MSLDVTNPNKRTVVFVKIELDGLTLRFATENAIAFDTDGLKYFWEGRVIDLSGISLGFNDFRESNAFVSNVSITLANGKDSLNSGSTLDSYVSGYFWGNKAVTIFLSDTLEQVGNAAVTDQGFFGAGAEGSGSVGDVTVGEGAGDSGWGSGGYLFDSQINTSNSGLIFKGQIAFPDIFTRHDDVALQFSVYDLRYQDQKLICPNTFDYGPVQTSLRFPLLEQNVRGKTAPVIYGDFSKIALIPGFIIDIASTSKTIKVADSTLVNTGQTPIHSIQFITLNGLSFSYSTIDLTTGSFTINPDNFLKPPDFNGEILIALKGKTRGTAIAAFFGGSSGDLLEHPVEILFDLLVYYLGFSSSEIDSGTFTGFKTTYSSLKARGYFFSGESVVDLINSLCFEFGIEIYFDNGTMYLNKLTFGSQSITTTLSQDDILSYTTATDSNKQYFNSVTVQFSPLEFTQNFSQSETLDNHQKRQYHSTTKRDFNFKTVWNNDQASILERFGRLLYISTLPIRNVSLSSTSKCFLKKPTEWLSFTFHVFSSSLLLVRSLSKNLLNLSTNLELWDLGTFQIKDYATTGASTPASLAAAQSASYSVYHCDYVLTSNYNNTLKITTSNVYTATMTAAVYPTPELLATEIQRAINVGAGKAVTVSYSRSTAKFTIATNDSSNFTLHWTDTPEIGRSSLGFDVSSNSTGAATYTSPNVCPFDGITQASMWD